MFNQILILVMVLTTTTTIGKTKISRKPQKLNLSENLECQLEESNEMGIIKLMADCPELSIATNETNKLCDYEICSDLVCCPATSKTRLKKVCSIVDDPAETLRTRLLRNTECTPKDLVIKGVYQKECAFADRNPIYRSILQDVCNDVVLCSGWYCCPIEDNDQFVCTATQISSSIRSMVGPKCIDSNTGRQGTCYPDYDYPANTYMNLDKCGSYCCHDFYCVPDSEALADQPKSARECSSYTKYLSEETYEVPMNVYVNKTVCAPSGFVANRLGVIDDDFLYVAVFGYKDRNFGDDIWWSRCYGSLISDRFVLTLTECAVGRNITKIRLGAISLQNDRFAGNCLQKFDVARQLRHPDFIEGRPYDNLGLIELAGRVKFNFNIHPVCLPSSSDLPKWFISIGRDEYNRKIITTNQPLLSYQECQESRDLPNGRLNKDILNDTQFCAGSSKPPQYNTYYGDVLLAQHETYKGLQIIYGIITFVAEDHPIVYTKIFPYLKWIEETVWSN